MDIGEDFYEHLWRKATVDGCSSIVCRAKGANVGLGTGDGTVSASTMQFAKAAVLVLMFCDPRQAPLLDIGKSKLFEY